MHRALPYVAFFAIVVGFANYFLFDEPSLYITHPLAILGIGYLLVRKTFPAPIEGPDATARNRHRVRQVQQSGPLIASGRCGGSLGEVSLTGPLLTVSVYPGGLLIKPVLMVPRTVLVEEISRAYVQHSFLSGRPIVVEHAAAELRSPIKLQLDASPIRKAVLELSEGATPSSGVPATLSQLDELPALVENGVMILGLAVAALFIGIGISWAMDNPRYWFFGLSWSAVVVAIAALNVRRWWKSPTNRR